MHRHVVPLLLILVARAAAGQTWMPIGPEGGEVHSLAFDGAALFAANTRAGVFRSADGGGHWSPVFDGAVVRRVIADGRSLYAATNAGLFRSDDSGASWRTLRADAITDASARGERIYVSLGERIATSADGGATWTEVEPPPADAFPATVYLVRIGPSYVVAASGGSLFRRVGEEWQRLGASNVVAVVFDGSTMYAGGSSGVFRCEEAQCVSIGGGAVNDLAVWRGRLYAATDAGVNGWPALAVLATPNAIFAGSTAGVARSDDGETWADVSGGLLNVRVSGVAVADGALYAATEGQGIERAVAARWQAIGDAHATSIAARGATVIAAAGSLLRSDDGGATFHAFASVPADVVSISGRTIAAARGAALSVSGDDGATWRTVAMPAVVTALAIGAESWYAVAGSLIVSRDEGATWTPLAAPGRVLAIALDSRARLLIAIEPPPGSDVAARVLVRAESGWEAVPGSSSLPPDITSLAADDTTIYAGTRGASIFATAPPPRRRAVR